MGEGRYWAGFVVMWLLDREFRDSGYKFFGGIVDLYEPKLECLWLES